MDFASILAALEWSGLINWLAQSKPTEWLIPLVGGASVILVWRTGIFDVKRLKLENDTTLLKLEQHRLKEEQSQYMQQAASAKFEAEQAKHDASIATEELKGIREQLEKLTAEKLEMEQQQQELSAFIERLHTGMTTLEKQRSEAQSSRDLITRDFQRARSDSSRRIQGSMPGYARRIIEAFKTHTHCEITDEGNLESELVRIVSGIAGDALSPLP